jgi:hypothetical protein
MSGLERCLTQIQAIRNVAAGDEPAYVARSRIGRLTSSVATLVAKETGMPAPVRAAAIPLPATESPNLRSVASSCNHIVAISSHLAQPSEPLDDRWRSGWSELLAELADLEISLIALRDERG